MKTKRTNMKYETSPKFDRIHEQTQEMKRADEFYQANKDSIFASFVDDVWKIKVFLELGSPKNMLLGLHLTIGSELVNSMIAFIESDSDYLDFPSDVLARLAFEDTDAVVYKYFCKHRKNIMRWGIKV